MNLILKKYFIPFFVLVGTLSSCHFGDAEKMIPSFADKKRNLNYEVKVGMPKHGDSELPIVDHGVDGLEINWNIDESVAIFGNSFVMKEDTLVGSDSLADAVIFGYNLYRDGKPEVKDGFSIIGSTFTHWARHGEGENYAVPFLAVYPAQVAYDANGRVMKSRTSSIAFNYSDQCGLLDRLRQNHFLSVGLGTGICRNGDVTISNQDAGQLVLTPKMAIVRFSLTVPAEESMSLHQYVVSRSFSEGARYVRNITIENADTEAPGFNRTVLNLATGYMEASNNAQNRMILSSFNGFDTLEEIDRRDAQSLSVLGLDGETWGTSLYVGIPCTDQGVLHFDGRIQVDIKLRDGKLVETLYGQLEPITLEEGHYYITSAIELTTANAEDVEVATICKVN